MTDINRLDSVSKFWGAKNDEEGIFEIREPKGDSNESNAANKHNQKVCNLASLLAVREGLQKEGILLDDTAIALVWLLDELKKGTNSLEDDAMNLPF